MKIYYPDKKTEKTLTNERLIVKQYGKLSASIINRLSELRAADYLSQIPNVPPPRRHKLSGGTSEWGVDISRNYRIVITPMGTFDENDLSSITEVRIQRIEDYH